jgi:hypothetical protein
MAPVAAEWGGVGWGCVCERREMEGEGRRGRGDLRVAYGALCTVDTTEASIDANRLAKRDPLIGRCVDNVSPGDDEVSPE